jgi:hypothetical protein
MENSSWTEMTVYTMGPEGRRQGAESEELLIGNSKNPDVSPSQNV